MPVKLEPLPVPRHVPFTVTHPPLIAIPPANVDVEVFVTIRFVTVVVPSDALSEKRDEAAIVETLIVPPVIDAPEIEPPEIAGLEILVLARLSIL